MVVRQERYIDDETADAMLATYIQAFEPLKKLTATKQTLDDQDFRTLLDLDDVIKVIARNRAGHMVGFALMTSHLKLIPWISPDFYEHRYPDKYANGQLFYVPCFLVHPDHQSAIWAASICRELALLTGPVHGIVLMDCCAYNDEVVGLPALLEKVASKYTHHTTEFLDSQRYFAFHQDGLRDRRHRAA